MPFPLEARYIESDFLQSPVELHERELALEFDIEVDSRILGQIFLLALPVLGKITAAENGDGRGRQRFDAFRVFVVQPDVP